MTKIQITYKSGKQEIIKIELRDYMKVMDSLVSEGRLVSMKII